VKQLLAKMDGVDTGDNFLVCALELLALKLLALLSYAPLSYNTLATTSSYAPLTY